MKMSLFLTLNQSSDFSSEYCIAVFQIYTLSSWQGRNLNVHSTNMLFSVPHKGAYIIVLNFCTLSPINSTIKVSAFIAAITCMCECINSAVFSRMLWCNQGPKMKRGVDYIRRLGKTKTEP